jgi:ABC-type phosphate/phosphonate transport system ATPase subunit
MARRDVALIFQQFNLIRRLTAVQNVLAGRLASLPTWRVVARRFPRADRQIALACLDRVGLVDRAYARADQLSGGQQQRVAIARALINDPTMLLADEPTGNLDTASSVEILKLLGALNDAGRTVVIITHEEDIARFAKRVVRLRDGRIVSDQVQRNRSEVSA